MGREKGYRRRKIERERRAELKRIDPVKDNGGLRTKGKKER